MLWEYLTRLILFVVLEDSLCPRSPDKWPEKPSLVWKLCYIEVRGSEVYLYTVAVAVSLGELLDTSGAVLPCKPKSHCGHPEKYLLLLSKSTYLQDQSITKKKIR